jgi:tryptophan synthase beta chain
VPRGIHARGLRYHGTPALACFARKRGASVSPSVSALVNHGDIEDRAVKQLETFAVAAQFMQTEGIIPAPESAHAIRVAIDEALKCKATGAKKVIAANLSGHGHFDMMAYDAYHHGQLEDYEYPVEAVHEAMEHLSVVAI